MLVRIRPEAEAEAARLVTAAAEQLIGLPFVCKLRTDLPIGRASGWLEWLLARPDGDWLV